jgi:RNA polymerase sigma-70 factor, ECF subfamily
VSSTKSKTSPPLPSRLADPDTFRAAFDRHRGEVFESANRVLRNPVEAQDVVQEVFLGLWARPGAFDPRRGDLGPFLRLLGRSRALDRHRRVRAADDAAARLQRLLVAPMGEDQPARAAEGSAPSRALREGLRRLPQPQREAVVLNHVVGLPAERIAARSGVPVGTVKSRVRLGLDRLRDDPDVLAA